MKSALAGLAILFLAAPAARADNPQETVLWRALEGKRVLVKLDLPASHRGIDLRFDRDTQALDTKENDSRIREFDTAIREGDVVPITRIHVKDDMIEFQLAGGGFNWGSQKTTQTFTSTPKSNRESDLDKEIRDEKDSSRKKRLEDERNRLRRDREWRDDRRRREIEAYNLEAHRRDVDRALRSGSRLNLRFKKKVPADVLTPEGLMRTLAPYVDFDPKPGSGNYRGDDRGDSRDADYAPRNGRDGDWLRKGATRDELERRLGRPSRTEACADSSLHCERAVYRVDGEDVEITFVEGIVVKMTEPD